MIGESSAGLRHLRTPLKADPRSIARVVSIPYPNLLGAPPRRPGWHVFVAGGASVRVGGGSGDEAACELSKVAVHTGDPGFFFYIFMNRWGRNNFVPRPPYWHGRIEIREREMELEPWCDGLGELPSLS